jgi:hypothetical protein
MSKIVVHTDDLPDWAVRKQKLPATSLGFLREAAFPSPDGKGMESFEDKMLRQHWDEMVNGNAKARDWLLRLVIADNKKVLAAAPERPSVLINGIVNYQPLAPVLELLGCITVNNPADGDNGPPTIEPMPWFTDELHQRCHPDKLAHVLAWLKAGGRQAPRVNRDLDDD